MNAALMGGWRKGAPGPLPAPTRRAPPWRRHTLLGQRAASLRGRLVGASEISRRRLVVGDRKEYRCAGREGRSCFTVLKAVPKERAWAPLLAGTCAYHGSEEAEETRRGAQQAVRVQLRPARALVDPRRDRW